MVLGSGLLVWSRFVEPVIAAEKEQAPASETANATHEIALAERKPLAFLLITPTGQVGSTASTEIIRVLSELVDRHTNLHLREFDPQSVSECKGLLGCFVTKVRPDYDRQSMMLGSGGFAPYSEHLDRLKREKKEYPQLLLVLSNLTVPGQPDRLTVVVVDTDRALELSQGVSHDADGWERDLEARINENALLARPKWEQLKSEEEVRRYLDRVFNEDLRRAFLTTENWEPYGSIEVDLARSDVSIELDGTTVGTTRSGVTRLVSVTPGRRAMKLSNPLLKPYGTEVTVERGKIARLTPVLEIAPQQGASTLRTVLLWSGVGVAVVGASITGYAIANTSDVSTYCVMSAPNGACMETKSFKTSSYNANAAPTFFPSMVNPSGVLMAPLGYSLFAAGAVWSLSMLLFDRESEVPWLELIIGAVVGGASYAVSAALNPKTP
jgi:hypothetical protein